MKGSRADRKGNGIGFALAGGLLAGLLAGGLARAEDWPQWCHDNSRNMTSPEKNLPSSFDPGKVKEATEEIDMATTKNVKWIAKLGSEVYGNTTVSGGHVYVGTNNEVPRLAQHKGDRGIVYCLDEKDGKFLWQATVPKMGTGKVSDWEYLGITCSPTVDGSKVYFASNRNEILCVDAAGMANGNDGPFKDEAQYVAGPGVPKIESTDKDADILWRFDMREELGVFPHNATAGVVMIVGDRAYAATANGVDWSHLNIPSPKAPALVVLDKNTGAYLGEEASGISSRTLHSNWSSPAYAKVGGREMIIFGGGDGILYAYDPAPEKGTGDVNPLKELWRCDCNPPEYRAKDGKPFKYPDPKGPSECIATPVVYNNKIYMAIGQDPEHGEGIGALNCIDPTKSGDITANGGIVWQFKGIHRSLSTVAIVDNLLFTADFSGFIYCLDADTGKVNWTFDSKSHFWASPLVADGKLYIGTDEGDFYILAAEKTLKQIGKIAMGAPIRSSAIAANGTLYLATITRLYAIANAAPTGN